MEMYNVVVFATVTALAAISAPVLADDVRCPRNLGRVTIDGNVRVSAPCRLEGTTVKGNVHLYAGGSLIARDAKIEGNIQAENANSVDAADTHVNGSIQLDNLVGGPSVITRSTIGGNIQLKSNRSRLEVADNVVDEDVQAFSNTGGVIVVNNTIDGNLQCESNSPAPSGGGNRVSGNKEDQCANLVRRLAK
jgi:hypothetical protein